jgi:hypothetical protein
MVDTQWATRAVWRSPLHLAYWAVCIVGASVGLYFASRSIYLGATLVRAMPDFDHWVEIMMDYFPWLDGQYSIRDLFAQHNEHRIITTRIVLLIDAIAFDMGGRFPIAVTYVSLASIAAILAVVATRRDAPTERLLAFAVLLGIMLSICQYINLTWQFQVPFPIVQLAILIALCAAAKPGAAWLAVAIGADFVAVFSLGSGIFGIAPIAFLLVWLRQKRIAVLAAAHLVFVGLYFVHYKFLPTWHPDTFRDFYLQFFRLVAPPNVTGSWDSRFLGMLGVALFGACFAWAAGERFWLKTLSTSRSVLLAFAIFSLVEAAIAAYLRPPAWVGVRYGTFSLTFWASLFAFAWSAAAALPPPLLRAARAAAIVLAAALLTKTNKPEFEVDWRRHVAFLDNVTRAAIHQDLTDEQVAALCGPHAWCREAIERLRALRTGPFRTDGQAAYPMTNLLEQAISCDDADRAAKIIQDALGIESDDVVNYCFPKSWPENREQRAAIIGEWPGYIPKLPATLCSLPRADVAAASCPLLWISRD